MECASFCGYTQKYNKLVVVFVYRVMVVEDEKIIRNGVTSVINRFGNGMQVCWECADAYTAWDLFQAEGPDLVVTDIVMRGMTGLDLTRKIREVGSDVPVVLLSGYAEFEYARNAIQLGVCEYVVKPLNIKRFTELLARLKQLMDERSGVPASIREEETSAGNQAIRRVEEYVCANLGGDLSLSTVAAKVNLSTNYLSMLFKNKTNQKYTEYVLHMRMEKAKKLLQESEFKIYEISEICGYNSVKHFISAFKKYTGTTPMQYKNING